MIAYGISGGAFYLRAQMAAVHCAHFDFQKVGNIFIGTSAGAIISFVSAVLGVDKAWSFAQKINPADAIKGSPFNEKGGLSTEAVLKIAFNDAPVKQSLIPILKNVVSKWEFETWRKNSNKIKAFVTTADIENGVSVIWDLSKVDYEKALLIVETSARMQGMTEPVLLDKNLHWDGGQFDHNPAHLLFDISGLKLDEFVAVWSRPNKWKATYKDMKKAGYIEQLMRMIELDNIEKSNNDQEKLEAKANERCVKLHQIFMQRVLANFYDSSQQGQMNAVNAAILATQDVFMPF